MDTEQSDLLVDGDDDVHTNYDSDTFGHATYQCSNYLLQEAQQYSKAIPYLWCVIGHCAETCPGASCPFGTSVDMCESAVNNNLGYAHRRLGEFDEAREYYLEALGLWPGNCGALGYYTELHLQEKNITGAATYLKRMCKTCGSSTDSWDDTQETVAKFDAAVEAEGAEGVVVGDWYGESCLEDGAPRRGAPVVAAVVAVVALWLTT